LFECPTHGAKVGAGFLVARAEEEAAGVILAVGVSRTERKLRAK